MVVLPFLCILVLLTWAGSGEAAPPDDVHKNVETKNHQVERAPQDFKVFGKDGSESLTATCNPKTVLHATDIPQEITCRFTHVRFQLPSASISKFPLNFEEAIHSIPGMAEEARKDPSRTRNEWNKTIQDLNKEMCSSEENHRLETLLKDPNTGPKRRALFSQLLQACSEGNSAVTMLRALSASEQITCELWVDHFSLEFRHIDKGTWLFTQPQSSLVSGTLKIYELSVEPGHYYSLWTLVETKMIVNKEENAKSQQPAERAVWSWKNYDAYEIPDQCDFISHKLVQY